jgi:arsenate reductase-like glutaredoxin family protein
MDEPLPKRISELIERFERNEASYTSGQYNEAQLRRQFINSLLETSGWDQMLSLNKQLQSAKTEYEKTALQRQIDATDMQIDELVYELYGITDDERKIIEGQ